MDGHKVMDCPTMEGKGSGSKEATPSVLKVVLKKGLIFMFFKLREQIRVMMLVSYMFLPLVVMGSFKVGSMVSSRVVNFVQK